MLEYTSQTFAGKVETRKRQLIPAYFQWNLETKKLRLHLKGFFSDRKCAASHSVCPVAVWQTEDWLPSGLRHVQCTLRGKDNRNLHM